MSKSIKMIVTMAVIFMTALYVVAEPAPASDFEHDLARDNASVVITKYKGTAKNMEIPAQIEGLPVSELNITFYSNKTVENIIIPEGVKELAKEIFESNTSLKSVTIPQSVKSLPDACFKNCRNLSTVTLSEGLESIGYMAFDGCKSLKSIKIPSTVKEFELNKDYNNYSSAFADTGLTEIELPDWMTFIYGGMFSECKSFKSVKFGNQVYGIGAFAFSGTALEKIEFPSSIKTIDYKAFARCTALKEVIIPEDVTKIKYYSMYDNDEPFENSPLPLAVKAKLRAIIIRVSP